MFCCLGIACWCALLCADSADFADLRFVMYCCAGCFGLVVTWVWLIVWLFVFSLVAFAGLWFIVGLQVCGFAGG